MLRHSTDIRKEPQDSTEAHPKMIQWQMETRFHLLPQNYPVLNLRRLIMLRWLAILGQIATVFGVTRLFGIALPTWSLGTVIAILALFNLLSWMRLRFHWSITPIEFFLQLLVDVAALTALLYLTGGSRNPFITLLLLPVVIAASTLPPLYTWAMALLTVSCYSALMFLYQPLPLHDSSTYQFTLHIWGMWSGFFLCALLIAHFVVKMASTLRERDQALAQVREEVLRAEHILALGTLAAGTAHEFGTPLATMAVLTKDLWREYAHTPELSSKLQILRDQIERCKRILATMSASAGQLQAASGCSIWLDRYLETTIAEWRATRPSVQVQLRYEGLHPPVRVVAEQTLTQALVNILNNAADASPQSIEVDASWSVREVVIEVKDRGCGLTSEVASRAGQPSFSTKAPGQGLGLGLFLAHTTINRLGGNVCMFNRDGGGACTRVTLPLSPLLAA